jgi:hypothetical protein
MLTADGMTQNNERRANNLQLIQDRAESNTVRGSQQKGPRRNLEGMMLIMGIID